MSRNNALTVLQKTYDDSYLSCSTAVYYEGQGDELEAMRHWRSALDQIYEHNATKISPTYLPQNDTEKALQDALKELELQCKERIDLLEALRISRQSDATPAQGPRLAKAPPVPPREPIPRGQGSIGEGTVPAVAYSDLSRPSLPHRPSLPLRTSSEDAMISGTGPSPSVMLRPTQSNNSSYSTNSPNMGVKKSSKDVRSPSPEKPTEKRTMRTTLRSGRSGESSSKSSRKSPKPAAEGPSKAATLAWTSRGSRERLLRIPSTDVNVATSPSPIHGRSSMDQPRKSSSSQVQWDSHSRRLVTAREQESLSDKYQAMGRHSDEYSYTRPSLASVSAASSALWSSSNQDYTSTEQSSSRGERTPRVNPVSVPPLKTASFEPPSTDSGTADDSGDISDHRVIASGTARKPAVKRTGVASRSGRNKYQQVNNGRQSERPKSSSQSSGSDGISGKSDRIFTPGLRKQGSSSERSSREDQSEAKAWKKKKAAILKDLPPEVDETAAKQILNDIIVQGDEVHWGDIAGLEIAKNALREAVVYPFLRPDLFMGLREPARGMLLFGPPGTGKTMLARAVATESRSTFFSISASSLTSKYLGESEKLVKALFGLARALAPSIIFVDEIDSLLSQRSGSGEHEATRRIKTEFLIQWSDLQRAAAGRETTERDKERGDANRVLVLAATNMPWAIDEAARRRFVRRQYIPLPEPTTRETQLRTLLGQQKHDLSSGDIHRLVELTDGFSGSDITSLAKDAAMGPLRSLGEALLQMTMDEIRPIMLVDFEASLRTIRPSVSQTGLQEYEDWAREFGERGG